MLDVERTIAHVQAAGSPEELQAIILDDMELQTPEADDALALEETGAALRGDTDLAQRLSALRQLGRMMKSNIVFVLPDLPGSREAADQIRSMLNGEIPPLPSEDSSSVFFTVLASFKDQAEQKGLADLAGALAGLEEQAQAAIMQQTLPPLPRALLEWIDMPGWAESQDFLQAHQELLSDEATTMIGQMLDAAHAQSAEEAANVLEQHQAILPGARATDVAAAYAGLEMTEEEEQEEEEEEEEEDEEEEPEEPVKTPEV